MKIRLYEITRGQMAKFGEFDSRAEALKTIWDEIDYPLESVFVYTCPDTPTPSWVMQFYVE